MILNTMKTVEMNWLIKNLIIKKVLVFIIIFSSTYAKSQNLADSLSHYYSKKVNIKSLIMRSPIYYLV